MVVVNNALCFLKNKLGRGNVKILKSTLLDFYDIEAVSLAKYQLIDDVETCKTSATTTVKFRYMPLRRDDENRLSCEIDDILSLFTFLGEQKLLNIVAVPAIELHRITDFAPGFPPGILLGV